MKQFFKFMFASMVGFLLSFVLLLIIVMVMFASALSFSSNDMVSVADNSVLEISLDRPIVDRAPNNPFENLDFGTFRNVKPLGLNEILVNLKRAKKDDRIKGIYLETGSCPFGMATAEEIRNGLIDFKSSGKFIIAFSDNYSQKGYYIASVADKIYINPIGMLEFKGLSAQVTFLKGLSEKLKVEYQVYRPKNNNFKSAVEPLIMDKMSESNREQLGKLLNSIWDRIVRNIETERGVSIEKLNLIADNLTTFRSKYAVEENLADALIYKDQLQDSLRLLMELESDDKINTISISKYTKAVLSDDEDKPKKGVRDRIAVIYASGSIVMGDEEDNVISSEHISKTIREARKDDRIKAVVLRVNSGGGDGLASEIIWREVLLCNEIKPVIVSMGDYAASGGYYISCAATKIIAQPNTLTGSIGVFGVIPNLQGLFNDHLGITFDQIGTNENSDFLNPMRSMNEFESELLAGYVEEFYQHFIGRVAEGRNLDIDFVDSIGQGRVWSGTDALALGLIDDLGGLQDAIEIASEEAGIEDYRIYELPTLKDPFIKLIEEFTGNVSLNALREELGVHYVYFEAIRDVGKLEGVQARMPFFINIQ